MLRMSEIPASNRKGKTRTIRTQLCYAPRKGASALGTLFSAGDPVVKLESERSTGEVFFLTEKDLRTLLDGRPGKYRTRKSWLARLEGRQK
jgi:hypothetical protein